MAYKKFYTCIEYRKNKERHYETKVWGMIRQIKRVVGCSNTWKNTMYHIDSMGGGFRIYNTCDLCVYSHST